MSTRNRFNRPLTVDQVQDTIRKLHDGAHARRIVDDQGSHLMSTALHVVRILWREVSLHDNLAETAAETLSKVELALSECIDREAVTEAARVVEEVRQLRRAIGEPRHTFKDWVEDVEEQLKGV